MRHGMRGIYGRELDQGCLAASPDWSSRSPLTARDPGQGYIRHYRPFPYRSFGQDQRRGAVLYTANLMARATPRLRLDLSSPEDAEGTWTVVGKGRRRRVAPPPTPPPRYRQYRLLSHQETSDFLAIRGLEQSYPEANLRVTGSSRTGYLLCPQDEETAFLLARIARGGEEQFGCTLGEVAAETRGVVLRYPLGLS